MDVPTSIFRTLSPQYSAKDEDWLWLSQYNDCSNNNGGRGRSTTTSATLPHNMTLTLSKPPHSDFVSSRYLLEQQQTRLLPWKASSIENLSLYFNHQQALQGASPFSNITSPYSATPSEATLSELAPPIRLPSSPIYPDSGDHDHDVDCPSIFRSSGGSGRIYVQPTTPSTTRRHAFSVGSTPAFSSPTIPSSYNMTPSSSPSSLPTSPYAALLPPIQQQRIEWDPSPRTTMLPISPSHEDQLYARVTASSPASAPAISASSQEDYFYQVHHAAASFVPDTKQPQITTTLPSLQHIRATLQPIIESYLSLPSSPTTRRATRAPIGSQSRDEQNRQKSKRYYERKKAQLAVMDAIHNALCGPNHGGSGGVAMDAKASFTSSTSSSSSSAKQRLGKLAARAQEYSHLQGIAATAEQLRSALQAHVSSLHPSLQSSETLASVLVSAANGVSPMSALLHVWLYFLPSWADLCEAEKRLSSFSPPPSSSSSSSSSEYNAASARPILALFEQLWVML